MWTGLIWLRIVTRAAVVKMGEKPLVSFLLGRRLSIRYSFRDSCWVQGRDKTDTGIFPPTTIYLPIYKTYMGRIFFVCKYVYNFMRGENSVFLVSPFNKQFLQLLIHKPDDFPKNPSIRWVKEYVWSCRYCSLYLWGLMLPPILATLFLSICLPVNFKNWWQVCTVQTSFQITRVSRGET